MNDSSIINNRRLFSIPATISKWLALVFEEDDIAESSRLNYRGRSFQQARSLIDSGKTRGIYQFLESWATFSSRRFLAGRVYHRRVRLHLSLFLLFLPLFHRPASLGMLMSFFRNPSSLIRGTSPARFFVSERMSRLIDEWRTYTFCCGTSGCIGRRCWHVSEVSEVSEATFCRVLLYTGHPDISTDRDKYLNDGPHARKRSYYPPHTVSPIEEKNTVSEIRSAEYFVECLASIS